MEDNENNEEYLYIINTDVFYNDIRLFITNNLKDFSYSPENYLIKSSNGVDRYKNKTSTSGIPGIIYKYYVIKTSKNKLNKFINDNINKFKKLYTDDIISMDILDNLDNLYTTINKSLLNAYPEYKTAKEYSGEITESTSTMRNPNLDDDDNEEEIFNSDDNDDVVNPKTEDNILNYNDLKIKISNVVHKSKLHYVKQKDIDEEIKNIHNFIYKLNNKQINILDILYTNAINNLVIINHEKNIDQCTDIADKILDALKQQGGGVNPHLTDFLKHFLK